MEKKCKAEEGTDFLLGPRQQGSDENKESIVQIIYPVGIIDENGAENSAGLLKKKTLQIGLQEKDTTNFSGKGYVVLDFGRERSGGVRILTSRALGSASVRLRFGESVSETYAELGEKNATNDHSLRDFCVRLTSFSDMTFGQTGFRFLRIDAVSEESRLEIKSVVCVSDADEREEIGRFECDDPLVNTIWNTAAYTLRLCLHNGYFWDGVKRDRLVWIGDLYPEMKAAHCLYGEVPETENSLLFAESECPVGAWIGGFPNYSLWWLLILCEEYRHSGSREKLGGHLPYAKALLQYISGFVTEKGDTIFQPDFIDWPTYYEEGESIEKKEVSHTGTFYLLLLAMKRVRETFVAIGEDTAIVDELLHRLSERKVKPAEGYKQIAALGVWAGDRSCENGRIVCENGARGLSTFMAYEVLSAVAAYGKYEEALEMLREYYGGMLTLGATTFWEDFDLDWMQNACGIDRRPEAGEKDIHGDFGRFCYVGFRHSLCHGWAAGVIPYLMETVAGIRENGVGGKCFSIKPHLSGLKKVKAVYPTPNGSLIVEHFVKENGELQTKIIAPEGITASLEKD